MYLSVCLKTFVNDYLIFKFCGKVVKLKAND